MANRILPVFEGKVAGIVFLLSITYIITSVRVSIETVIVPLELFIIVLLVVLWKWLRHPLVMVVLTSHILGVLFACGTVISMLETDIRYLGLYIMVLTFFHISEYVVTAIHNPAALKVDSFLINHSVEYGVAALASWVEYGVEYYFFPWMKSNRVIPMIGMLGIVAGEVFRKTAMLTAATNFTHNVQYYKRYNHNLVTTGVYGLVRHPSYVGWFYWSISTQLLLCNPFCFVVYSIAAWVFFKDRIDTEEQLLIHFFGKNYIQYQGRVGTGLPFIAGYQSQNKNIENT